MHWLAGRSTLVSLTGALAVGGILAWTLPPPSQIIEFDSFPPSTTFASTVLRGAFHVHSRWSDGSGTVDEIALAGAAAGLDFVILTDHGNGMTGRPPSYRGGVLVVQGTEIGTDGGHYVALGLPAAPYPLGGDARGVVEDVRRLGGFGVIAHPTSPRAPLAWSDWSLRVDGVEWLNGDSQWRDDGPAELLRAVAGYWFRAPESLASLLARPERALERWDTLAAERPVVGLGATDAHARLALGTDDDGYGGGVEVEFPGYEETFRAFAIRVELDRPLTGAPHADAANLVAQVRAGRVYTAIDALASPVRFAYRGRTSNGRIVRMGERALPQAGLTLTATVAGPPEATLRLLRNGRPVARQAGRTLEFPVDLDARPAAYRVEVTLPRAPGRPPVPWIVSNPIYVGGAAELLSAPGQGGPPLPLPGDFWQVERRSDAAATLTQDDSGFRLAFTLGHQADTYVAAARTFSPGALIDSGALRLAVESSRPMRASLQLRRRTDGSVAARWRRSFHAGPERRVLRAEIDEFAPAWSEVPARPELADVDSLLIAVDTVNTVPGSRGVLTIEDIGVEPR